MKKVVLDFGGLSHLAGYLYGVSEYKNQVKDCVVPGNCEIELLFPYGIINVTSSFIEGFFSEINHKDVYDRFTIKGSGPIVKKIKESMVMKFNRR